MTTSYQQWSILIKYNISPNQVYFLDSCKHKIKPASIINGDAEALVCRQKGYIDENNNLSGTALRILEEYDTCLVKTKTKVAREVLGENFNERVKEYREIFPSIRFPSGELARQNVKDLTDRFVWFFKNYPEYDWNLVLDAADYYIHLKEKVEYQYAVTSLYFIKKTDAKSKETKSMLADICQEILDNPKLLDSL